MKGPRAAVTEWEACRNTLIFARAISINYPLIGRFVPRLMLISFLPTPYSYIPEFPGSIF